MKPDSIKPTRLEWKIVVALYPFLCFIHSYRYLRGSKKLGPKETWDQKALRERHGIRLYEVLWGLELLLLALFTLTLYASIVMSIIALAGGMPWTPVWVVGGSCLIGLVFTVLSANLNAEANSDQAVAQMVYEYEHPWLFDDAQYK